MKRSVFLGAALAIIGGAGLIFGNEILASNVLAVGKNSEPAIVMPVYSTPAESDVQLSGVGLYSNDEGQTYMALTKNNVDTKLNIKEVHPTTIEDNDEVEPQTQNPTDGNLSEEEAKQMGISALMQYYNLTQKDIKQFDIRIKGFYTAKYPSEVVDWLSWCVTLTPVNQDDYPTIKNYSAMFDDKNLESFTVQVVPLIKEGKPSEKEISAEKAKDIAITALTNKYALTKATLEKFTVNMKYYEVTPYAPNKHVWWVNLYPTNTDEFAQIGCYWTYIDAETGEPMQLFSATDGKG